MLRLSTKLLIILFFYLPVLSWALPGDREKPIEIEADHAQIDDKEGITQYKGQAILTQGSLRIEGDIITFYYDENKEINKAIVQGKLAKYQQIQNPDETPIRAQALQMEYHAKTQIIFLLGEGRIWQNKDQFSGARIKYDIANNIVNASSSKTTGDDTSQKRERIHLIIQPPGNKKRAISPSVTQKKTSPKQVKTDISSEDDYPKIQTTSILNIRTGPGTQYKKIAAFKTGDTAYILTEQKDWLQVRGIINGQTVIGWISRRYTQAAD